MDTVNCTTPTPVAEGLWSTAKERPEKRSPSKIGLRPVLEFLRELTTHNKILRAVIKVVSRTHLMPRPANPSPRRYSSSGGHSRRKMNALTFSCIRQPSSSCSPAPGESSSRRCSSQSRWASRGCFTRRRTSRYAAIETHRPWSGALLPLEGGRPCLEGPRAGWRLAEKACGSRKDVSVLSTVTLFLVNLWLSGDVHASA